MPIKFGSLQLPQIDETNKQAVIAFPSFQPVSCPNLTISPENLSFSFHIKSAAGRTFRNSALYCTSITAVLPHYYYYIR